MPVKKMTDEEKEILGYDLRSYRNDYESDFKNGKPKDYSFIIETNLKHIEATMKAESYDNYADHYVGQAGHSSDYKRHDVSEEKTTDEEFQDAKSATNSKVKNQLICLYLATKEAMEHRSGLSKFFHPLRTRAENKNFELIKKTMKEHGIDAEMVEEVDKMSDKTKSMLPSAAAELERERANDPKRIPIAVDLGEKTMEEEKVKIEDVSPALEENKVEEL